MSDTRDSGTTVKAGTIARVEDSYARAEGDSRPPLAADQATDDVHLTPGVLLWTLTHHASTAQARRWSTATGYELEMVMWTGERIAGQEDLSWSQLFASDDALARAALAKKRQLESAGWLEELDVSPVRP